MNMKNIILVLLAALTLVGFAAAWDSTDNMYTQYQKTAYIQGGDPVPVLVGTVSGSFFDAKNTPLPWETQASFANNLVSAGDKQDLLGGAAQSGHATLTQIGGATATIRAPDDADGLPEQSASFYTSQNMHFGPAKYIPGATGTALTDNGGADMAWAQFASEGSVGINGLYVGSGTETEAARGLANDQYEAIGAIEGTAGTSILGADIGVQSTTGFTNDLYTAAPLISGSTTAYAGFTGGVLNGAGSYLQSNAGDYETTVASQSMPFPVIGNGFPTGYPSW
jgi:hypothetical protein